LKRKDYCRSSVRKKKRTDPPPIAQDGKERAEGTGKLKEDAKQLGARREGQKKKGGSTCESTKKTKRKKTRGLGTGTKGHALKGV